MKKKPVIESFDLSSGRVIAQKYVVIEQLGAGWESEVYLIREDSTGIERAAKIFFPQRNPKNRVANFHAKKLHKLRNCAAVIQYHSQEAFRFKNEMLTVLISDYIEGEMLLKFLGFQPKKRLDIFQGLGLLHTLAVGVEDIHRHREYHGDLHLENIMVKRHGLGFHIKLLDFFQWHGTRSENLKDDICDLIKIFYDAIGGSKQYSRHPPEVKEICCGLKRTLILQRFPTVSRLRDHLENMEWESC